MGHRVGLTISKRLAEILGGDATVESRPGKGSTFALTVDAGIVDRTAMIETAAKAMSEVALSSSDSLQMRVTVDGRILPADDRPDDQRRISLLLRNAGATVELVQTGNAACEKALAVAAWAKPIDVILIERTDKKTPRAANSRGFP